MKTVLIAILVLTLLIAVAVLFNNYIIKQRFRKFIKRKYDAIHALRQKLETSERVSDNEIMPLVRQPALRQGVYQVLSSYNRTDLFPSYYYTCEKGAESYLVTWLEFPTELGRAPEEIQLLSTVALEQGQSTYYVFKYRSHLPPWAAKLSWMLGVAGPYSINTLPYDVPGRIFSRFNTIDTISVEDEVKWVHENINQTHGD
jgi:hypothetical protein